MKNIFISFLVIFGVHPVFAQNTFERAYDGQESSMGLSVLQTSDGGFIMCGPVTIASASAIRLVKTNAAGDTVWTRTHSGDVSWIGDHAVAETEEGGFIICGEKNDMAYLLRINSNGDSVRGISPASGSLFAIEPTNDNGYITCGRTPGYGILMIKLDAAENIQWTKTLDDSNPFVSYRAWSVKQIPDSGYIVCGARDGGWMEGKVMLYRATALGDSAWLKIYDYLQYSFGYSVSITSDGGYFVAGYQSINGSCALAIRTDELGDTLWVRKINGQGIQFFNSGVTLPGGGFVACGSTEDPDGIGRMLMVRFSGAGDSLWARKFNLYDESVGYSIRQNTDGGFIISGSTKYDTTSNLSMYLVKTDSTGVVAGIDPSVPGSGILVYPNPATDRITVEYNFFTAPSSIQLVNLYGQLMCNVIPASGKNRQEIDISNLSPGIYFIRILVGETIRGTRKVLVE